MHRGELLGAVFDDEAIEHGLHDALFVSRQGGDRFKEQRQALALRPALFGIEDQFVERDVQRQRDFFQAVERGLCGTGLVAAHLVDVQAGEVGELVLGERLRFAQADQVRKQGSECTFLTEVGAVFRLFGDVARWSMPGCAAIWICPMPRQPRLDMPGVPQHVVQRGNDRQPCFFADVDRGRYLDELREIALAAGCRIHAYVLMDNHVHLLLTPSEAGQVGRMMQSLGRRYVRYVNDRYHRTGTLWEGRYKSCLVDSETYFLSCSRYIELNPVRAGMVASAGDYRWSSYGRNGLGQVDRLISEHPVFTSLGATSAQRQSAYRALFAQSVTDAELESIRLYLQRQHALGSDRFREAIERQLNRRAGPARIGRPRKSKYAESVL